MWHILAVQDGDVVQYLQASGEEGSVGMWLNARAWAQDAVHTATRSLQDNVIRPLTAKQRDPLQDSSLVIHPRNFAPEGICLVGCSTSLQTASTLQGA